MVKCVENSMINRYFDLAAGQVIQWYNKVIAVRLFKIGERRYGE